MLRKNSDTLRILVESRSCRILDSRLIGIPDRVIVLEDSFDGMEATFGEAFVEKVQRVKEDFANLGDKIDNVEEKLVDDLEQVRGTDRCVHACMNI